MISSKEITMHDIAIYRDNENWDILIESIDYSTGESLKGSLYDAGADYVQATDEGLRIIWDALDWTKEEVEDEIAKITNT
jgi:hypothetical protein